jgi:hypothetical protein
VKEKAELEDQQTKLSKENTLIKQTLDEAESTLKQLKDELEAQKSKAKELAAKALAKSKLKEKKPQKKPLKFKSEEPTPAECVNCARAKTGEPVNKNLVSDNQLLTNELILVQRDLQKLKGEHKTTTE